MAKNDQYNRNIFIAKIVCQDRKCDKGLTKELSFFKERVFQVEQNTDDVIKVLDITPFV
jgi:hypothetical protein